MPLTSSEVKVDWKKVINANNSNSCALNLTKTNVEGKKFTSVSKGANLVGLGFGDFLGNLAQYLCLKALNEIYPHDFYLFLFNPFILILTLMKIKNDMNILPFFVFFLDEVQSYTVSSFLQTFPFKTKALYFLPSHFYS